MTRVDPVLVDTNVLLGATDRARQHHGASMALLESGRPLVISAQVIREYLVVATRPVAVNGLGLSREDGLENLRALRTVLRLLPEERPLLGTFLTLIEDVPCAGKRLHDAFLVATAIAHAVPTLATWNLDDYVGFGQQVRAVRPDAL
jgi:predicted nucleic acid-binding protein